MTLSANVCTLEVQEPCTVHRMHRYSVYSTQDVQVECVQYTVCSGKVCTEQRCTCIVCTVHMMNGTVCTVHRMIRYSVYSTQDALV